MQVPIDAQLKLNTQEASQAIQDLNKTMVLGPGGGPQGILGAGGPLNQISPLSPQSFQMYNNLNMNMRTFTDQLTKVIEKFKVFEKSLEEVNTNGMGAGGAGSGGGGGFAGSSANSFFKRFFASDGSGGPINGASMIGASSALITSIISGAEGYTQAQARGDYMGARSSMWNNIGSGLSGAGTIMALIPGLRIAGALTAGVGAVAKLAGTHNETKALYHGFAEEDSDFLQNAGNYWGEDTTKRLELLDNNPANKTIYSYDNNGNRFIGASESIYGQTFNKKGRNITGQANSERLYALEEEVLSANKGYGLDDAEFQNLFINQRKYNVNNKQEAINNASRIAYFNNTTGTDISQLESTLGLMSRYGKGNGNDLDRIYQASSYSGLDKSQFGEFLSGIQQAMQEGIQKGFVRSADSISDSLVAVAKIGENSENPNLWKGENGARLLSSFSSAMGQATNLADTGQMIMFQAMKNLNPDMDYWDIMKKLEIGDFDEDYYNELIKLNQSYIGSDKGSMIELLRKELGVNYTQAIDITNQGKININENEMESETLPQQIRTIKTNEVDFQNWKRRQGKKKGLEDYTKEMDNADGYIMDSGYFGANLPKYKGNFDGGYYANGGGLAGVDMAVEYLASQNPEMAKKWQNAMAGKDFNATPVTEELIGVIRELITALNESKDIDVNFTMQDMLRQGGK